ncbi:MAG: hypothetical protein JXA82_10375 [Sedimentisphaerales bacterium]|nr:hypothetical protein [Sedimentisphaerales bacterium]
MRPDINADGYINLPDFARLASQWLRIECDDCGDSELTCDDQVDFADLGEFNDSWLYGGL